MGLKLKIKFCFFSILFDNSIVISIFSKRNRFVQNIWQPHKAISYLFFQLFEPFIALLYVVRQLFCFLYFIFYFISFFPKLVYLIRYLVLSLPHLLVFLKKLPVFRVIFQQVIYPGQLFIVLPFLQVLSDNVGILADKLYVKHFDVFIFILFIYSTFFLTLIMDCRFALKFLL